MTETKAYKVEVFLNREEDEVGRLAIFSRLRSEPLYVEGDKLECVLTTEVTGGSKDGVLETVFALTNRGSGIFIGDKLYPQRSLSAGDVVALDGERFLCDRVGFKALACPECGGDPCYRICPANPDYFSQEQERENTLWNESLSDSEYRSLAMREYEEGHGEPYVS
jgi:hypothetical protein